MIGTIANTGAILVGSITGSRLKNGIGEKYKTIMLDSMGLVATALGIGTIAQAMPNSRYHVLFIVSLALGGVIGTFLDLDTSFRNMVGRFSGGSNLAPGAFHGYPFVLYRHNVHFGAYTERFKWG